MSYLINKELLQSQDTWKRSQIRLTPTLYKAVNGYAKQKDLSLNSAMIELMNEGLLSSKNKANTTNPCKKIGVFEVSISPYIDEDTLDTRYFNNKSLRELTHRANEYITSCIDYEIINIETFYSKNLESNQILTSVKVWFSYVSSQ